VRFKKKARILSNTIQALVSYQRRRVRLNHPPSYLWIEPTNHCNLKCIMCPNGAGKVHVERGFMDLSLFQKIVNDIHPQTSAIILAMGGESLLHPALSEMIRAAEDRQIKIILNTNATLLDEEKTDALLRSGTSYISFAFDGFNKSMYEKARRGADFERTLANILHFLRTKKERKQKKPYTVLSILDLEVGKYTPQEKAGLFRKLGHLVDDIHLREANSWGRMFMEAHDFKCESFEDGTVPCGRLWNTLGIAWNGDIVPCTYHWNHDYVVGNINDTPLAEAWNGARLTALRQAMLDGRYLDLSPVCENCTVAGSPKILGLPAGLRASAADCLTNFFGYGFEKKAVRLANLLRKGRFTARPIK